MPGGSPGLGKGNPSWVPLVIMCAVARIVCLSCALLRALGAFLAHWASIVCVLSRMLALARLALLWATELSVVASFVATENPLSRQRISLFWPTLSRHRLACSDILSPFLANFVATQKCFIAIDNFPSLTNYVATQNLSIWQPKCSAVTKNSWRGQTMLRHKIYCRDKNPSALDPNSVAT